MKVFYLLVQHFFQFIDVNIFLGWNKNARAIFFGYTALDGGPLLGTVLFDTDSTAIRAEYDGLLTDVANQMKNDSSMRVYVDGHTDSTARDAYNMDLSRRRSISVSNALRSKGAEGTRLQLRMFGETRPTAGNNTSDGRQRNRRVELRHVR